MENDTERQQLKFLLVLGRGDTGCIVEHLCRFPDGLFPFEHALQTIQSAAPFADTIYISVRGEVQQKAIQYHLDSDGPLNPLRTQSNGKSEDNPSPTRKFQIIIERDDWPKSPGPGSAAGLLAAHDQFPNTDWLVVELGFPLLHTKALQQLIHEHKHSLRCLVRADGTLEPLLAVWNGEALRTLKLNIGAGLDAPDLLTRLFKCLNGKRVKPQKEEWILKPQTNKEWDEAMKRFKVVQGLL